MRKLKEKIKKYIISGLTCFGITSPNCPAELENKYHEHLIVADYNKKDGFAHSKLIPNLKVEKPNIFICPRCKTERKELKHGEMTKCDKCDLGFLCYGNSLYIWETKKLDKK